MSIRRVDSLGAGVQSTAMYLLACDGERIHAPEVAVFADTGVELETLPAYVPGAGHGGVGCSPYARIGDDIAAVDA